MIKVVTYALDLDDAMLGDEEDGEDFENLVTMGNNADETQAPIEIPRLPSYAMLSKALSNTSLTSITAVHNRNEGAARLDASYARGVPVLDPRTKWMGGAFDGTMPVPTCVTKLDDASVKNGMHVLDMFSCIT